MAVRKYDFRVFTGMHSNGKLTGTRADKQKMEWIEIANLYTFVTFTFVSVFDAKANSIRLCCRRRRSCRSIILFPHFTIKISLSIAM